MFDCNTVFGVCLMITLMLQGNCFPQWPEDLEQQGHTDSFCKTETHGSEQKEMIRWRKVIGSSTKLESSL